MRRTYVGLGILGMLLMATAANAAAPAQVTLFGQTYSVEVHGRDGTYKNGVTINLQSQGKKKANLCFVEGADPSTDRLFVVAPLGSGGNTGTGDQFYLMTGTDKNGIFNPANSTATQFFGGNVGVDTGGRPNAVAWISDPKPGAKQERNIVLTTFQNDDYIRFYDLNMLNDNYVSDTIFSIEKPDEPDNMNPDPGMPYRDFEVGAPGPNGTLLVAGQNATTTSPELGVIDPMQDKFFNVKTSVVQVTSNGAVKFDQPRATPHSLMRIGENEYWMLASQDQTGDDDITTYQNLYRLRLTFPPDFSKAGPNSIQVEILGEEDMLSTNLAASDGGIFGMTAGRVVANGPRRLYLADWQGNLITLTPIGSAAPATP